MTQSITTAPTGRIYGRCDCGWASGWSLVKYIALMDVRWHAVTVHNRMATV